MDDADEDVAFFTSLLRHVKKLASIDKLQFRINVEKLLMESAYGAKQTEVSIDVLNSNLSTPQATSLPTMETIYVDGSKPYVAMQ